MATDELALTLDHVTLSVADLARSRDFYEQLLVPIGLEIVTELPAEAACTGFGIGRKGTFWLAESGQQIPQFHICFRAQSREAVRGFYAAGLAAGGTDNGEPGVREVYHPAYYAAFILDLEGHNVEAVCFEEE